MEMNFNTLVGTILAAAIILVICIEVLEYLFWSLRFKKESGHERNMAIQNSRAKLYNQRRLVRDVKVMNHDLVKQINDGLADNMTKMIKAMEEADL